MIRLVLLICLGLVGLARADAPPAKAWEATTAEIIFLARNGQTDAALVAGGEAMRRARDEFGDDDPRTAEILTLVAELHMSRNEWAEAERLLRKGVAIRERILPPLHWAHEESQNLLAAVYAATGRFDEAERSHRWSASEATKAAEAGLSGPHAPRWVDLPSALDLHARNWHRHGRIAELPALHAEILDAVERWGTADIEFSVPLLDGYVRAFEYRDDRPAARRAAQIMERFAVAAGDDRLQARAVFALGRLAWLDDDESADALFLAAWALADDVLDADDPERVRFAAHAASAAIDAGRDADAERWLRDALRIADAQPGQVGDLDHARCRKTLAELYQGSGRHAEAVPLRRDALRLYRGIYGEGGWMVASALHDLGDALQQSGDIEAAREAYAESFTGRRRSGEAEGWLDADLLQRWLTLDLRLGDLQGAAQRWSTLLALRARAAAIDDERGAWMRRELAALHRVAGLEAPLLADLPDTPPIRLAERYTRPILLDLLQLAMRDAGAADDAAAGERLMLAAELMREADDAALAAQGYDKALSVLIRVHGPAHPRSRFAASRLATLHREGGRQDLAALVEARVGGGLE